jgi:hypothetical protein
MQDWLKSEGCIARAEIEYIDAEPYDLLNIGQVKDQAMSKVAHAIQRAIWFVYYIKFKVSAAAE